MHKRVYVGNCLQQKRRSAKHVNKTEQTFLLSNFYSTVLPLTLFFSVYRWYDRVFQCETMFGRPAARDAAGKTSSILHRRRGGQLELHARRQGPLCFRQDRDWPWLFQVNVGNQASSHDFILLQILLKPPLPPFKQSQYKNVWNGDKLMWNMNEKYVDNWSIDVTTTLLRLGNQVKTVAASVINYTTVFKHFT